VAIVGLLGEVFYASGNIVLSLVATGIVAILFQPLRERVQHGVNRLLYGNRDEPYAVLSRLSHQLATTLEPEAVLPNIVETVARNLKLPYAAIELVNDAGNPHESLVITFGNPSACTLSLPLEYQGEKMGKLILAQRTPDEPFTPSEHRLLINIADQAGVAAHAFRLTRVLQRSREQLVTSREEERRRIQRDLHDGLGPALATMKLKLDSLQYLLPIDIGKSSELASDVAGDVQRALDDIRLLVHELRPPALDQLGLVAALREFATRLTCETGDCLQVEIEASPLPPLAAAVEVAAYRIVTEALTNVIKHAHARHCIVTITKDIPSSGIIVTIEDDGIGLQANAHATVGLRSMRERAEELGGKLAIESRVPSGTRVKAWLPWSE
jgi:signal transduction histidine kinase